MVTGSEHGAELVELQREVLEIKIEADYAIAAEAEATVAADSLRRVNGLLKKVDEIRKAELLEPLALVGRIRAKYKEPETLLEAAQKTLKAALGRWTDEIIAAQEKARLEAEKALAGHRTKVSADAAGKIETLRAKAAELRAEAAGAFVDDRPRAARLEEQAAGLDAQAELAEASAADRLAQLEQTVPAPETEPAFDGVSTSAGWAGEVQNLRRFMASCLADEYLDVATIFEVKASGLKALAKTYGIGLAKKYPGAVGKPQRTVSARSK